MWPVRPVSVSGVVAVAGVGRTGSIVWAAAAAAAGAGVASSAPDCAPIATSSSSSSLDAAALEESQRVRKRAVASLRRSMRSIGIKVRAAVRLDKGKEIQRLIKQQLGVKQHPAVGIAIARQKITHRMLLERAERLGLLE